MKQHHHSAFPLKTALVGPALAVIALVGLADLLSGCVPRHGSVVAVSGNGIGDGRPANEASLRGPHGMAIDSTGRLYIADTGHYRVRRREADGTLVTVVGTGIKGFAGDGGPAITARLGHSFELRMDNVARIQADNLLRVTGGNRAVISSLGLSYRPTEWRGAAITVQADNLWNSSFQEVPAVPAARRTITGGVSYAW